MQSKVKESDIQNIVLFLKFSVEKLLPECLQEAIVIEESHQLAYNLLTANNSLDEKYIFVEFD